MQAAPVESSARPRGFRHSVSFWVAVALAAAVALPLPLLGILPIPFGWLVYAASIFAVAPLVDLLLVSLFLEAIYRRIPRFLLAIPILLLGAYYALFIQDTVKFRKAVASVHDGTPANVIRFDPETQSLVMPDAKDAVAEFALPVVYEAEQSFRPVGHAGPESYLAWRLLSPDQCALVRKTRVLAGKSRLVAQDSGCLLATPEQPEGHVITLAVRTGTAGKANPAATTTTSIDIARGDKVLASAVVGVSFERLSLFPWPFVGYFIGDGSGMWGASLWRDAVEVGHVEDATKASFILPAAAAMLDLRRRPAGGVISPAEGLDAVLGKLPSVPNGVVSTDDQYLAKFVVALEHGDVRTTIEKVGFRQVKQTDFVLDGALRPAQGAYIDVLKNRTEYAPFRDRMVKRLVAWRAAGVEGTNGWVGLVQDALIYMPESDLIAMPDDVLARLLANFRDPGSQSWSYFDLYARIGDLGKRVLPFYEAGLADDHSQYHLRSRFSALAICHIGAISDSAREILRTTYLQYVKHTFSTGHFINVLDQNGSAAFLALLAAGDRAFLRDHPIPATNPMDHEWFALLLAGKGWVHGRPNNCASMGSDAQLKGDPTGPGLGLTNKGHWVETALTHVP